MKNTLPVVISILFILFGVVCPAQETLMQPAVIPDSQNEQISDSVNLIGSSTIKKGNIILNNGDVIKFSNLNVINDTVFFTKSRSGAGSLPLNNVTGITKTKSRIGLSTLVGGAIGLIAGTLTSSIVNPDRTFGEWLGDQFDGDEEVQEVHKEDAAYIAIGTASGIAVGAVVGLFVHKSTVVYHKNTTLDVFPGLSFSPGQNSRMVLSVKINFN